MNPIELKHKLKTLSSDIEPDRFKNICKSTADKYPGTTVALESVKKTSELQTIVCEALKYNFMTNDTKLSIAEKWVEAFISLDMLVDALNIDRQTLAKIVNYKLEALEHDMNVVYACGYKFELVESFPRGYHIWNIGSNMPDGYLPLCRLKKNQRFEGGREIETDTLKAIKCESAQTILKAVMCGGGTLSAMKSTLKKNESKTGELEDFEKVKVLKEGIFWLEKIPHN